MRIISALVENKQAERGQKLRREDRLMASHTTHHYSSNNTSYNLPSYIATIPPKSGGSCRLHGAIFSNNSRCVVSYLEDVVSVPF